MKRILILFIGLVFSVNLFAQPFTQINAGESGLSVRTNLNNLIGYINGLGLGIEFSVDGSTWHYGWSSGDNYMRMSDDWGSTWSDAIYLWDGGVLGSIETDTLILGTDTITGFTNVFLQVSDSTIYATQTDLAAISDSTFVNATITDTLFLAGDTITDVQKVTGAAGENYILSSKAYVDSTVSAAGGYTDEDAQDAIGAILDDGTLGDIIFTYTDATPTIHATVKDNSIVLPIDSITGLQDSLDARITAEVDGSVTNEGSLTVKAGTSSTSVISSNTSGSTDVTLSAGSNITLSETGNTITIAGSSEMVYPSAGIPLSTGTAWGTSVTNNSANWNTSYDWGYTAAIIKNQSAISIFQYPHSAIVVNDTMFLGERKADPYIIRFNDPDDLTDYNRQAITGTGSSSGGLESVCYDETNDRLYFGIQDAPNGALKIVEVDPSNLSGYSIHTISGLSTYYTPPICTDGSYIYGATAVSSGTKLFKINIATWDTVKTVSWANGYQAHSCQINTSRNEFYIANSGAGTMYMAKVSTSDLSYSDVDISTYCAYGTDDMAFYDDGITCNVFIAGETKVGNYGGVMVTTTAGNSLTGIDLKPSYGLFEYDNVIYNCGLNGYVQAFSVFNPTDISTFVVDKLTPTEVLKTSSGQTFITDWKAASSCRLYEFHVPVSIPTTNISGVTSITAGTAIDVSSTTGDVTVNVDLSELSYEGTVATNDYALWIDNPTNVAYKVSVSGIGKQIFPNGDSYSSDLNSIAQSGVYYAWDGSTNKPSTTNGYVTHLQWTGNTGYAVQTFVEYDSDVLYIRRKSGGTWQSWTTVGGSGTGDMTKAVYDADENNVIDVIRGGTGQSGYTTGDLLYANSTVTLAKLNAGTSGYVLTSNGAGVAPSWQAAGGGSSENFSVVSLSGTSVSWNMSNGINAKITLSGNTTITLSNVPTGRSGNLTVTNPSSTYTITFSLSGKTVKVSPFLNSSSGAITMSGGSKIDVLSWYYDGTYFIVNGTLDYD